MGLGVSVPPHLDFLSWSMRASGLLKASRILILHKHGSCCQLSSIGGPGMTAELLDIPCFSCLFQISV